MEHQWSTTSSTIRKAVFVKFLTGTFENGTKVDGTLFWHNFSNPLESVELFVTLETVTVGFETTQWLSDQWTLVEWRNLSQKAVPSSFVPFPIVAVTNFTKTVSWLVEDGVDTDFPSYLDVSTLQDKQKKIKTSKRPGQHGIFRKISLYVRALDREKFRESSKQTFISLSLSDATTTSEY